MLNFTIFEYIKFTSIRIESFF